MIPNVNNSLHAGTQNQVAHQLWFEQSLSWKHVQPLFEFIAFAMLILLLKNTSQDISHLVLIDPTQNTENQQVTTQQATTTELVLV